MDIDTYCSICISLFSLRKSSFDTPMIALLRILLKQAMQSKRMTLPKTAQMMTIATEEMAMLLGSESLSVNTSTGKSSSLLLAIALAPLISGKIVQ